MLAGRTAAGQVPSTEPVEGLHDNTPAVHALLGARVIVAPGEEIAQAAVVIRNGVIEAVGAGVEPPGDARVWRCDGKVIYPGLFDAFSTIQLPAPAGGAPYWNRWITPQCDAAEHYSPDKNLNAALRRQGITCRLAAPRSGIIKGTSAVVTTGDASGKAAILKDRVALHVRLEPVARSQRDEYPNSPMGAVALARQAMYDAQWYRNAWQAYRTGPGAPRPERNDALAALARFLDGEGLVILEADDEQDVFRADRFAREFGLRAVVRASGKEYRRLDAVRATGRPMIVPLDFPKPPDVATPEAARLVSLRDLMDWDLAPENPAQLAGAGAVLLFCSDRLEKPDHFLQAVRKAVRRGLDPHKALAALTTEPAAMFGLDDRLGTLQPGKAANLVVATGDLFDERTKLVETWIDGRRYRIAPEPAFDLRGTWQARYRGPGPGEFVLELAGEPGRWEGVVRVESEALGRQEAGKESSRGNKHAEAQAKQQSKKAAEKPAQTEQAEPPKAKEAKLRLVGLADARFSCTFDGAVLGTEGTVQLSAVITQGAEDRPEWDALLYWPDASSSVVEIEPRENASSAEQADEADSSAEQAEQADEAEKEASAGQSPGKSRSAESAGKAEPDGAGKTEQESAEKAAQTTQDRTGEKSLFPVNYPLGAFGRPELPPQPEHVLFRNATVWTCDEPGVLENASVLVGGGKILAVGRQVDAPKGAIVVDAAGKHLTPGIIDCHSHMGTDGGVNESTQAITAEVRIGDFIDASDIDIYRQLAGGVTTILVLHGSANPIGGQCQAIKLRWGALPEELKFAEAPPTIKFALGENVKQSNWGDQYTTRYPQTRMGVEQIIRDAFRAARDYENQWQRWEQTRRGLPPRRDLELDALVEVLHNRRQVHCHAYRQDEVLALLRIVEEYGLRGCTLQHILEGYKVADEMARLGVAGSCFSDWWAYKFEVYDAIPYNAALMHAAGVVVSLNSDDRQLARHLNHEAAKLMRYGGLPAEEALKFVTIYPARQMLVDRYVGSIAPGKQADLTVWSGPPLAHASRCEQTWVDGRRYFDLAEDRQLRQQAAQMKAALIQRVLAGKKDSAGSKPEQSEGGANDQQQTPREDLFEPHRRAVQ